MFHVEDVRTKIYLKSDCKHKAGYVSLSSELTQPALRSLLAYLQAPMIVVQKNEKALVVNRPLCRL